MAEALCLWLMRARMFESGLKYVCVIGLSVAASGIVAKSLTGSVLKSMSTLSDVPDRPLSRVGVHLRAQTIAFAAPSPDPVNASAVSPEQLLPVSQLVAGLERAETPEVLETPEVVRSVATLPVIALLEEANTPALAPKPGASASCQKPKCRAAGHRAPLRSAAKARPKGKKVIASAQTNSRVSKSSQKIAQQAKQTLDFRGTVTAKVLGPDRKQRLANAETPGMLMRRGFLGWNS